MTIQNSRVNLKNGVRGIVIFLCVSIYGIEKLQNIAVKSPICKIIFISYYFYN